MNLIATAAIVFTATAISVAVGTKIVLDDNRSNYRKLKDHITMKTNELLDAINTETNNLAQRIADHDAKIKTAGELTPELEAEGQAIVTRLQQLAADPVNPVPAEEPNPSTGGDTGSGSTSTQS